MENEKLKIKLSELTDMYDIEDDSTEKITKSVEKVIGKKVDKFDEFIIEYEEAESDW